MIWIWFTITIITTTVVQGQFTIFEKCPNVTVMEDFEPQKYIGIWYTQQRYRSPYEMFSKCESNIFNINENNTMTMIFSKISKLTGVQKRSLGLVEVKAPGKLSIQIQADSALLENYDTDYCILGTDYISYAVVFSCNEAIKIINKRNAWILTREKIPKEEAILAAYKIFEQNNMKTNTLIKINQSDCVEI